MLSHLTRRSFFRGLSFALLLTFTTTFILGPDAFAMHTGASDASSGASKGLSQAGAVQSFQADLFTGRATHGIPIFVPPGRKGLQPQVGLSYSQGGPNTWVGQGWGLETGFIQRSTKFGPPIYSDSPSNRDTFLMSFQGVQSELLDVADPTAGVRELRLQDEGLFLKIIYDGTGFTVFDKGDTKYSFGAVTDSRIPIPGKGTFRWMLDKVTDPNGNTVTYHYAPDPDYLDNPHLYLKEILYTGPNPTKRVEFILESQDRPDPVLSLQAGGPILIAKRLKEIISQAEGQQARRYVLDYQVSRRTGKSLLVKVTEYGTDNTLSLPPVTFKYEEGAVTYDLKTHTLDTRLVKPLWTVRASSAQLPNLSWTEVLTAAQGQFFERTREFAQTTEGDLSLKGSPESAFHSYAYLLSPTEGKALSVSVLGEGEKVVYLNGDKIEPSSNAFSLSLKKGYNLLEWIAASNVSFEAQSRGPFRKPKVVRKSGAVDQTLSFTASLTQEEIFLTSAPASSPRLAGDFNGDAVTDLAYLDQGTIKVALTSDFTALPDKVWLSNIPPGATPLIGDFNGDGRTDLGLFETTSFKVALSQAGESFTSPQPVGPAFPLNSTPLVADFNGDGHFDLGFYQALTGVLQISLARDWPFFGAFTPWGSGWGAQKTPFTGDFNGDGLTDMALVDTQTSSPTYGTWWVALSNGRGFEGATVWTTGALQTGSEPILIDCDQNGTSDIGCFNPTTGEVKVRPSNGKDSFGSPLTWFTFPLKDPNLSFQVGDFNGDGLQDPAVFHSVQATSQVAHSKGEMSDLLTEIDNGQGGKTTLSYIPSTQTHGHANVLDPTEDLPTKLPFVLPVLHEVKTEDGLGHTYSLHYDFRGGVFNSDTRDFLGFRLAKATDAESHFTRTWFHQEGPRAQGGGWLYPQNPHPFKGRVEKTEALGEGGELYTQAITHWKVSEAGNVEAPLPNNGIRWVYVAAQKERLYDGDETFKETLTRFAYDVYGNLSRTVEYGEVRLNSPQEEEIFDPDTVSGGDVNPQDNRTSLNQYVLRNDAIYYFASLLERTRVFQGAYYPRPGSDNLPTGAPLAERRFFYDQEGATSPDLSNNLGVTKGHLTHEAEWLKPPGRWVVTRMTYDSFGNVKTVKDPKGAITTNTYDLTGTYLIRIQNALGHAREFAYDPRTGSLLSTKDLNGQVSRNVYDVLGRVIKTIGPLDSETYPTTEYEYTFNLPVPGTDFSVSRTITRARIEHGAMATLDSYSFADGLGRGLQTRSPAEDSSQQVVSGSVVFNSRGLVEKEFLPYFDSSSQDYEMPEEEKAHLVFSYDPLGRKVHTRFPNTTETNTLFDDWHTVSVDPNFHMTQSVQDAYGRLTQVYENYSPEDPTQAFVTTYRYDLLDNLIETTDALGNKTGLTYDSLTRKTQMSDPDMGVWSYAYDDNDNLTKQTDAKGQITTFIYDPLNRLTRKSYSDGKTPEVLYTYDEATVPFGKGRVTKIQDGSGVTQFKYDKLGQVIQEIKTLDSASYSFQRTYDALGRIKAQTYPDGGVLSYTYNPFGDVERMTLGNSVLVQDVSYNPSGQIELVKWGNGTTTDYTYDPLTLRLASLKTAKPNRDPATSSPEGLLQDFSYAFDRGGNVTAITDALHSATQAFGYDALDRLIVAQGSYGTQSYQYNAIGNMTRKGSLVLSYEGPQAHAVTQVTSDKPGVTEYEYDPNGNRIRRKSTVSEQATNYSWDPENRLTQVDDTIPQEGSITYSLKPGWNYVSFPFLPEDKRMSSILKGLTFGKGGQVMQISRMDPTGGQGSTEDGFEHWVNDPLFNDFSTFEYGLGYGFWVSQEVTFTVTGHLPQEDTPLKVKPGRNLIAFPRPTSIPLEEALKGKVKGVDYEGIYHFNPQTQAFEECPPDFICDPALGYFYKALKADTINLSPAVKTTRFVYDGDGGRVKKVSEEGATVYLGKDLEIQGSLTTKHFFLGGTRIASVDSTGKTLFYHSDHLGGSNVLSDAQGKLVSLTEYTPWGETTREEVPGPTSQATHHKFTGQEEDPETGLYFYGARYYDPKVGRFISPDTIVQDPSNPQSFNRYNYCLNNPVNLVDPTGNLAWFIPILIGALVGAKISVTLAFINGGIHKARDFLKAFGKGALNGALWTASFMAGQGFWGATGLKALQAGTYLNGLLASAPAGYLSNGTDNLLEGESFNRGAGIAVFASMVLYSAFFGVGKWLSKRNPGTAEQNRQSQQDAGLGQNNSSQSRPTTESAPDPSITVEDGAFAPGDKVKVGDKVYRVYGGKSTAFGNPEGGSFTRVNPNNVSNFREAAGLPRGNTGRFVLEGEIIDTTGIWTRSALPGKGGIGGGLDELIIPNAVSKVRVLRVSGSNPEF